MQDHYRKTTKTTDFAVEHLRLVSYQSFCRGNNLTNNLSLEPKIVYLEISQGTGPKQNKRSKLSDVVLSESRFRRLKSRDYDV